MLFLRLNSQEQYPYRIYGQPNMLMAVPSTHEDFHIAAHWNNILWSRYINPVCMSIVVIPNM